VNPGENTGRGFLEGAGGAGRRCPGKADRDAREKALDRTAAADCQQRQLELRGKAPGLSGAGNADQANRSPDDAKLP
jgi:hypothetical protein